MYSYEVDVESSDFDSSLKFIDTITYYNYNFIFNKKFKKCKYVASEQSRHFSKQIFTTDLSSSGTRAYA